MRIVIDTNVLASAIVFGGKPAELMQLVLMQTISAVATQEIIAEYQSTIDSLFQKYKGRDLFFSADSIYSAMEIIPAQTRVDVCRDPDDNKFISCAIDGQCYYIVSGDKDLLTLKEYSDVKIVTVAEFFELMNAQGK